jgi:regulator of PEP synthase PpsR (kinase-PPPase family)
MAEKRIVYFISDRTGITAEALGKSLLTQFDHIEFERHTLPFIDTPKRAAAALDWINRSTQETGQRPIVFSTLMNQEVRAIVAGANALFIDFFATFITPLETEFCSKSSGVVGKAHGMGNDYLGRMNAVNFTLGHDDGLGNHLDQADIILIGVSRCGKTPTCLYLALQYGLYAANYPLTPDDFEHARLPDTIRSYKSKLFGLSINPERLAQIRHERKPDSDYARLSTCRSEIRQAEALFKSQNIPFIDSSAMSIEEIASNILHQTGLSKS